MEGHADQRGGAGEDQGGKAGVGGETNVLGDARGIRSLLPSKPPFLCTRHGLDPRLPDQGLGPGQAVFLIKQFDRQAGPGVSGALSRLVLPQALLHVLGDPRVVGPVPAAQDVDRPGGRLAPGVLCHPLEHLQILRLHTRPL